MPSAANPGMQKVALDAKGLQGGGLVPDEALGKRCGVRIEGGDIGGTPPSACWHKALKASSHIVILAGKAPDCLAAKPGVLVERPSQKLLRRCKRPQRLSTMTPRIRRTAIRKKASVVNIAATRQPLHC